MVTFYEETSQTLIFLENVFYLLQGKLCKNDEKCFLFHLKSSLDLDLS